MPTYEYKCLKCDHRFELFQKMTADPVKECPVCGGEVKRLIGAGAGPIFKGSGFYQTDYKNKSSNTSANSSPNEKISKDFKGKTSDTKSKSTDGK